MSLLFSLLSFSYSYDHFQKVSNTDAVASSLMDIDPSPIVTNVPLDLTPDLTPVVCLPYSLVPGLDTTSHSYQKAVITLGKQKSHSVPVTKSVPLISVLDRGMTVVTSSLCINTVDFDRCHCRCLSGF